MMDPEEMLLIDAEVLLVQLLAPLLPGIEVVADVDASNANTYPMVIVSPGVSTAMADAPTGYGYDFTTSIAMVARTRRELFELGNQVHRAIHYLGETTAAIPGVGRVAQVTDVLTPRRTGSARVGDTNAHEALAVYGWGATH